MSKCFSNRFLLFAYIVGIHAIIFLGKDKIIFFLFTKLVHFSKKKKQNTVEIYNVDVKGLT